MEISVQELAELLKLAGRTSSTSKNVVVSKYHQTWGQIFKEVAPMYGNPDMRNEQFGKMISQIHAMTKERMKNE